MDLDVIAREHIWPTYQKFINGTEAFPNNGWQDVVLIGPGGRMDSLKFVHFLLEIEERLSAPKKLSRNLTTPEPFRTMGSFALHIQNNLEK